MTFLFDVLQVRLKIQKKLSLHFVFWSILFPPFSNQQRKTHTTYRHMLLFRNKVVQLLPLIFFKSSGIQEVHDYFKQLIAQK